MSDMPARSAQTPLQPGATHGSSLVTPASPLEASAPVSLGPNALTSDGIRSGGGAGSPLVTPAQPMEASKGIYNGGQDQGCRYGEAWPTRPSSTSIAQDGVGTQTDMDVRYIDIPQPPHASQSTGHGVGATDHG